MDDRDASRDRRARMAERIRALQARRRRPEFAADLAGIIGYEPDLNAFLAPEATALLREQCQPCLLAPALQRRTWSTDLRSEMAETLARLATALTEERAFLLHRHDEVLGVVLVPVAPMLEHAEREFGTWGQEDLWLARDDGRTGLRLAWDHLPDVDEYELVTWGDFKIP